MTWDILIEILKRTGIPLAHYATKNFPKLPYIVYTDYARRFQKANNRIVNEIVSVQVDLFAKSNDEESFGAVKNALDENEIPFEYIKNVELTEKGRDVIIHHIFDCEAVK